MKAIYRTERVQYLDTRTVLVRIVVFGQTVLSYRLNLKN